MKKKKLKTALFKNKNKNIANLLETAQKGKKISESKEVV